MARGILELADGLGWDLDDEAESYSVALTPAVLAVLEEIRAGEALVISVGEPLDTSQRAVAITTAILDGTEPVRVA